MNPRWRQLRVRLNVLAWAIGTGLVLMLARFATLQILESGRYRATAEENSVRLFPLAGPRGEIVDRNGEVLATSRPSFRASLVPNQLPQDDDAREEIVGRLIRELDLDPEWFASRLAAAWEQPFAPIRLAGGLTTAQVARLEERRFELPGLIIEEEPLRVYPHGSSAAHVLGYIGEVSPQDMQELGGEYVPGDLVGKAGIEQIAERWLRGKDGGLEVEVDALGRQVRIRGRREPEPGHRLVLTLDRRLQERCEELLGDRAGAMIVMEARTGEILAMATNPRYDPGWFASGRISTAHWNQLMNNSRSPMQNRAIQALYSPGSIFKVVTATAGLETGELTEEKTFECQGIFWIKAWYYRCWNENGHGWLNVEQALIHSCDIFFYNTGLSLKADALARYADLFGFGDVTGIDLPGEKAGHVPTRAWKERLFHLPWFPGNTVQMSIGQGYLLATPLQLVQLMDFVALEGRAIRPHVLRRIEDARGRVALEATPQVAKRIAIAPSTWNLVKRGLWGCVNYRSGTGYRAHLPNLSVAGKTSTIQNPHGEDHAAFAAYAPAEAPEVVAVAFVEHGQAGGTIAAQITRSALASWLALKQGNAIPPANGPGDAAGGGD